MSRFSTFIQNLKKKIFGVEKRTPCTLPSAKPTETSTPSTTPTAASVEKPNYLATPEAILIKRNPYFIQIGFDFGTSYSKCICRDVMTDKAWVFIPPGSEQQELPFLIPGTLQVKDGRIEHVKNHGTQYVENGLYLLKQALVNVALSEWKDFGLDIYRDFVGHSDMRSLPGFVKTCAVYYLAGALGGVRKEIRRRLTDFGKHPQDYMAVNLAVPVANAELPRVNDLYQQVLCEAWGLADELAEHPSMSLIELEELLLKASKEGKTGVSNDACFIYPEVSASVQGFVRSHVSSPGIYMFSDTGAGTVDQSIFIFSRQDDVEKLAYLHAKVLPLGSSHIERQAALNFGKTDWQSLEMWRTMKEQGEVAPALQNGREWVAKQLSRETEATLAFTKTKKLYVPEQLNDIRVIFGGGGHCTYPYKTAVMLPFSGPLFRNTITPDVIGLPIPLDLELNDTDNRWMRRLYVAYGLSFEKGMLTNFIYPNKVRNPEPEEIWAPRRYIPDAPSQDVC